MKKVFNGLIVENEVYEIIRYSDYDRCKRCAFNEGTYMCSKVRDLCYIFEGYFHFSQQLSKRLLREEWQ